MKSNNIKINSWFILIFKKNLKIKFSKFKKQKFDIQRFRIRVNIFTIVIMLKGRKICKYRIFFLNFRVERKELSLMTNGRLLAGCKPVKYYYFKLLR